MNEILTKYAIQLIHFSAIHFSELFTAWVIKKARSLQNTAGLEIEIKRLIMGHATGKGIFGKLMPIFEFVSNERLVMNLAVKSTYSQLCKISQIISENIKVYCKQ
jgi:hypothetical protein